MKFSLLLGLVALLALCSSVSGYVYMYGDTQILPGDKPAIEVCNWEGGDVTLGVYKLDTGTIYEFMASPNSRNILNTSIITSTPVYQTKVKGSERCTDLELPALGKGVYLVLAQGKDNKDTMMILSSELGLVAKQGEEKILLYSMNLTDGSVIPGADLKIYYDGGIYKSGKTDGEGIFTTASKLNQTSISVIAQKGDDIALLSSYFYSYWGSNKKIYVYTDRPIYRPGQEVYFKAVLWEKDKENQGSFKAISGSAKVEIKDAKGNLVYQKDLTINEYGSVSGSFLLGDEPPLGHYSITVQLGENEFGYGNFQVEEYKKPEYQVTLTPLGENYISGDNIKVELDAGYYFGSPVTDAQVQYTIRQASWYYPCRGYVCYYVDSQQPYYYGYGDYVSQGTGMTDAEGKFMINFTANNTYDSAYTIEANVVDKSRREVSASAGVVVARGEFDFTVDTDKYSYSKGDDVRITITSTDVERKPVSEYGRLKITRRNWDDKNGYSEVDLVDEGIETSSAGEAVYEFVADQSGSFYVTITGKDSRGNNITSQGYFYVRDTGPNWDHWDGLDIILDKETYEVGDTTLVTINSPAPNFTVLLTVEGTDVYDYVVKKFEGTSGTIEVPVKDIYSPNVQIYAITINDLTQYTHNTNLIVPPLDKFLNISISSDKDTYMPGDEAVFTIDAKDIDGSPVSAELSFGLVDESIYALAEESIQDIEPFFYGMQGSSVSTTTSLYYRGGIEYAINSQATLGVDTTAAVPEASMADEAEMVASGKMATGGSLVEPTTRKYFPDTAFWHAFVKTDKSGKATIRVTIPDSLTTWRATARAIDKEFRVGQSTDKVISRKNLLVRLEAPRFLTQGDDLVISAVVHNYLPNMKDVLVELDADGVELLADSQKTVSIANGGDERVDWRIKADSCCKANFTVRALTDEESDAMQVVLPIMPYGVEERDSWSGSVTDSVTNKIIVPQDSVYGATKLSVFVSPSIAATAFDALDYLTSYPYGCVEQTMSSFLPDVYVAQVLKSLDINDEELEKELPDMVSKGLQKLYSLQHSDGGWGWWENDDTHPYMTAYVVYGLTQAKAAGFTVDENVLDRGLDSLRKQYGNLTNDPNTKAYIVYALSFHGGVADYPADKDLSDYGKALKTLAMLKTGTDVDFPKSLTDDAICDETYCHWSSQTFKYSWRSNDVETTAYVLMALIKTDPENEMVEKTVAWLVANRHGNMWGSTKDTAIAVFSLAEYLKVSKELSPDYIANVYLNGDLAESVKKADAFSTDNEIVLSPKVGTNEVRIEKDGEGKLYYSVVLSYFKTEEPITAKSSGITVDRQYNVTSTRSGDYIKVTLTIDVPEYTEYVILEDPIPAGCEVVEDQDNYYGYWRYWYSNKEVRDEKVAYFMTYLHPGKNEITYTLRAEVPGTFKVLPATAWNMYDDKIRGHSAENTLEIADELIVGISEVSIGKDSVNFFVDSLKMVKGDLSGEIQVQLKDLKGNVLGQLKEYVSLHDSSSRSEYSIPASLKDGVYTIYYTLTTSEGNVVSGSKRIQVGTSGSGAPEDQGQDIEPESGADYTPAIIVLLVLALVLVSLLQRRFSKRKAEEKKAKMQKAK